jgi:hypothetical protein
MMNGEHVAAKVPARARMAGVKIHGPNSPEVLSGSVPLGYRETVDFRENAEQLIEMDFDQCVAAFGVETAKLLFAGIMPEEANDG